jgi:hypothetical protein
MSSFTQSIKISASEDHNRMFYTLETYVYSLEWREDSDFIRVDSGFTFDGASVPAKYDWVLPRWDSRTIKAALFHDYLYKHRHIQTTSGHHYLCTRRTADKLFLEMLQIGGQQYINRSKNLRVWRRITWKLRIHLAYLVLRLGGWIAWYRHRFNL